MRGVSLVGLLDLALALLLVSLAGGFLLLPHVVPENTHFFIIVFVEVEVEAVSQPDLKEVIIQALLGNAYFPGSLIERVLLVLVGLVASA